MSETTTDQAAAPDERRAHIHRMWAAVAPSWGEHADYTDLRHEQETTLMIELTDPRPGERVLELACGAGGLGMAAAERVGARGAVVLSDVASEMAGIAEMRARARNLHNVSTRVLDLEAIDEPDAAYDVVLCRDGLQFTVDPARGAREIHRIARPDARAAIAVWGPRERNPWLGTVLDAAAVELQQPLPPPGMPGPFALTDGAELSKVLEAAGFADVALVELSVPMQADSFDEWWSRTCGLAGPLASILASLTPDVAERVRARAQAAVVPFETPSGLEFEGVALIASARRERGSG